MGAIFWQSLLWYVVAFVVGVALAWLLFVRPVQRALRQAAPAVMQPVPVAAPPGGPAQAPPTPPAPPAMPDEPPTQRIARTVDPALSVLDSQQFAPWPGTGPTTRIPGLDAAAVTADFPVVEPEAPTQRMAGPAPDERTVAIAHPRRPVDDEPATVTLRKPTPPSDAPLDAEPDLEPDLPATDEDGNDLYPDRSSDERP